MARTPGGNPFEFVRGAGEFSGWRGVRSEGGKTAPPSNQPQMAINLIASGGRLKMRPHEVEYLSTGWTNIHGIFDLDCPPLHMWMVMNDCAGATGGTVMTYSFDDDPEFQSVAKFWGVPGGNMCIGSYGSSVYVGENGNLRLMLSRALAYGDAAQNQGEMGSQVIHRFTGPGATIRALKEFDGRLWIAVYTSGPNYTIYEWDGVSMVSSLTAGGDAVHMDVWADNLVVSFNDAGSNYLKLRSSGSGGSWSTVVPAAGSLAACRRPQTIKSYHGILYVADSTTGVWSYDGVTLASAHTVAGATMKGLEVFNDKLYYAYDLATTCRIGEYDWNTAVWTDTRKNLTTQYANNRKVHGICSLRGSLWCGVGSMLTLVTVGGQSYYTARLVVSPGKNVGGTWIGTGSPTYDAGMDACGPVVYTVL